MDNFRAPNFELVAEVLYWLFQRREAPFSQVNSSLGPPRSRAEWPQRPDA